MQSRKSLVLILFLLVGSFHLLAQNVYLKKGKKKIDLTRNSYIGLTTVTDTISFSMKAGFNYSISEMGRDSLLIRKPATYIDTFARYKDIYENKLGFEYTMVKYFKKDGELFCTIKKILTYEEKQFAYKDITSLTSFKFRNNDYGCIGCWFVPGLNVYWAIHVFTGPEKTLDMKKWSIHYVDSSTE